MKLWGLYDGNNTENNIFQTWYDGMLAPGTEFFVEAAVMSHADDWIGNGNNSLVLFAKYFTADWGWIGMDASMPFDGNHEASEWHYLGVDCVVPEGASTVQVGAMLIQPTPDDHGSVYMDDFYMHIPMTSTGLFVSYGDLADGMLEAGISDLTWTWDIWSSSSLTIYPKSMLDQIYLLQAYHLLNHHKRQTSQLKSSEYACKNHPCRPIHDHQELAELTSLQLELCWHLLEQHNLHLDNAIR